MCDRDQLPALTPKAAADRLADRHDVPELTAGLLDREPTREHDKYLKTTPGFGVIPDHYRRPWGYIYPPAAPLIQGLPEV